MPHSPRFYGGQHWLLESGYGSLLIFDPATGERNLVAHVPGFTRGMDFYGPYAFIGLSQVRETATFSGIPLVEKLRERTCGIWVIDLRTGATAAFLKFEGVVQEIFAVQVLAGHPLAGAGERDGAGDLHVVSAAAVRTGGGKGAAAA